MKILILPLVMLIINSWSEASPRLKKDDILGSWQYVSYLYQGQLHPLPNENLKLVFVFRDDGTEDLSWSRLGSPGFCEATAVFNLSNGLLISQVVSTNPHNSDECSSDPDMQVGKQSNTPVEIRNGQLFLNIGLSGEDFYYIFDPVNQAQTLSHERNL